MSLFWRIYVISKGPSWRLIKQLPIRNTQESIIIYDLEPLCVWVFLKQYIMITATLSVSNLIIVSTFLKRAFNNWLPILPGWEQSDQKYREEK